MRHVKLNFRYWSLSVLLLISDSQTIIALLRALPISMEANLMVSVATMDHPAEISSRVVEVRSKIPALSNPAPPAVLSAVPTASEISLGSGTPVVASFTIDAPRVVRPSISISGQTLHLPVQPSAAILDSLSLAANFNRCFNST